MSNIELATVGALKVKPKKGNGKVWDALEKDGGVDAKLLLQLKNFVLIQKADVYSGMLELSHQNY